MADFFDTAAELGSEEDDEDFDDEAGETRQKKANGTNGIEDSSEEEEEDDDEALRAEGEGFVVDEDDDEVEERKRRRRKKRKNREADEELDEEDLDLIGADYEPREQTQSKYKRLKRGHKERPAKVRGVDDIFSDDEDLGDEDRRGAGPGADEFADFIEEEEFEDELDDDREVGQPGISIITQGLAAAGLDQAAEEDYRAAFGDGTDYDWALAAQEEQDAEEQGEGKELQLKDVFEPAQLKEQLLTEEDNVIRDTDVPERMQLARRPFNTPELSEEDLEERMNEEALWITKLLWPKKALPRYLEKPFRKTVRKVLEYLNVEEYEVPFIFNHRKDYLIHAPEMDDQDPDGPPPDARPARLLNQSELWEVFDLDLKYRAFAEKRHALQMTYDNLREVAAYVEDSVVEDLIHKVVTIEEVQELQDYLHYQWSTEMKDLRNQEAESNGTQKRANNARSYFDKIRGPHTSKFVSAIGISADQVAKYAEGEPRRDEIVDQGLSPEDFADTLPEAHEHMSGAQIVKAAKMIYVQNLVMSPRLRRYVRANFYQRASIDCVRTDKGMRKITEDHPYYEFKYLRGQTFMDLHGRPELFLKMLKAEAEGLINVKIRMANYDQFKDRAHSFIRSENTSALADAWNALRVELLDAALDKLQEIIAGGVKETLRAKCEEELASRARDSYNNKLDQAPFKPRGALPGFVPNVVAISNGQGQRGDAICWALVENDGRVVETGKLVDFKLGNRERGIPDGKDVEEFVKMLRDRHPDVIGISGMSVQTRKLYKDLQEMINMFDLKGNSYDDPDDGSEKVDPLDVTIVNDEVARLYYNSARAQKDFPRFPALTRYCIALARYLQNPLAEYASLGKDIVSIPFVESQTLIPQEKLLDKLETAMVDMVNLVGIDIREAYDDPYLSPLIQYVCGLGPRKANRLIKAIQANGDEALSRFELLGISEDPNRELRAAVGPKVFQNCASFLYLEYQRNEESADYLDNTRIHPEDYDLARKMVADAMNMDEEDIKAEVDEGGPSAVIHRMIRDDKVDDLHDLMLEAYASEIEKKLGNRKRATLETIRAELTEPYEEIRQSFAPMSSEEIFTMLTGETKDSLTEHMVVPVQIRRTFADHVEVKLECGIEGLINELEFPEGVGSGGSEPRHVWQPHQTVRAKIMFLNRKALSAQLSLREEIIQQPSQLSNRIPGEWDDNQEAADRQAAQREREVASGRPNRVINHPLFFQFSSAQAEEYLGSKDPGEVIIRPSSKGLNHLAVTWKVLDNSYQHIDVLELDKPTEYSLGKKLLVGKTAYSDLDELIVTHVEAMAKKVVELTTDDRFKKEGREFTDQWLAQYCAANPGRFMYAFCAHPRYPGYFWLCFRAGALDNVPKGAWPIKVIPNAYELRGNRYPDLTALKNGFKIIYQAQHPKQNGNQAQNQNRGR